jgi:hypothetical protein
MYGDVWTVSSATSSLTQIDPGVRPVIRRQHALFSRNASTFFIFGGQSPTAFLNDMWEFVTDSSNVLLGYWQQYTPQTALVPPPMSQMQAVYDSMRDKLWVWHGMYAAFDSSDPSTAMWTFSFASSTWTLNAMTSLTPALGAWYFSVRYDFKLFSSFHNVVVQYSVLGCIMMHCTCLEDIRISRV